MSLTTLCMMGGASALPPPSELLHLNQVSVGLDRMVSQGCTR